jgi:hypothetical protein
LLHLHRTRPKSAVQIGDEVLNVLDANGYPDKVVGQAAGLTNRGRNGCV